MQKSSMESFVSGRWNSYKIDGIAEETLYTPVFFTLRVDTAGFKAKPSIESFDTIEGCMCFILVLEEKNSIKEVSQVKFKLVLNDQDRLLMCSRKIPERYMNPFKKLFAVTSIKPYELEGSSPRDLILLYRYAHRNHDLQNLYWKCKNDTNISEPILNCEEIPKIREMSASITSAAANIGGEQVEMEDVHLSMAGNSIFEFYKLLIDNNITNELPEWMKEAVKRGKTNIKFRYETL